MADKCFRRCIPFSNTRLGEGDGDEMDCLRHCVNKHVQANHRTVRDFTVQQDRIKMFFYKTLRWVFQNTFGKKTLRDYHEKKSKTHAKNSL